jgi:flagella basal body P-ring formation protein FlgA
MAAALGMSGASATPTEIVVTLHEAATIDGARVALRDVASIGAPRRALAQRIASLDLGPAPPVHDRLVLRQEILAARIERQIRHKPGLMLRWTGAAAVTVQRGLQTLPPDRVQAAAEAALRDWMARQPVARYEIEPIAVPPETQVPSGDVQLGVRPLPTGQAPAGHLTLWVDVRVDDRTVRQLPVVMKVRSFAPRWVARTDVVAGSVLDPADFEQREVALETQRRPALSMPPATPARLTRPLRAGQVLEAGDLAGLTDVTRGEPVTASIQRGLVSVQARGEALQDGRSGQSIRVRIAGATAAVLAEVTGPGRVQVNE